MEKSEREILTDNIKYLYKSKITMQAVSVSLFILSLFLLRYTNFHIFHISAEVFASIISFCIFIVAVNTYQISKNDFFMFLGIGFLCVGVLDLLHTFTYSDLNIFSNATATMPAQFWMSARAVELFTILLSTIYVNKKINRMDYVIIAAAYISWFVFTVAAIMKFNVFPVMRIQGQGLTDIKVLLEYIISAGFIASFALFYRESSHMDKTLFVYIGISVLLKVPQGICFTMYAENTDLSFFIGHILKIISYYFMYRAIVVNGLRRPLDMLITDLDNADSSLREKERQRKVLEEAVLNNEHCYDLIINHSDDGIIIIKEDRLIFANSTAAKLFGAQEVSQLIGMSYYDFMDDGLKENVKHRLRNLLMSKDMFPFEEVCLRRLDGSVAYMESSLNYFVYREEPAVLTILRDIGPQKEITTLKHDIAESEKKLSQSQEYNKMLTEFFSNISHELKTPLTILLGTIQLISMLKKEEHQGIEKDKLSSYVGIMKQNTYRLIRLVNNLIDTSKYDSGYLKLNLHNHNIVSIVESISESVNQFVNCKGINMVFDTDTEEKIMAVDADKIERIILNLLSNAVKFTERGGEIYVNLEDLDNLVRVTVKDTGLGIPDDKLEIIFDRFGQVDKTFTRNREGSGIGLSLVKALTEMHGGTLSVKSEVGKGSEFIIELPVTVIEDEEDDFSIVFESKVDKINIEFSDIYTYE